jgi:hypothetical protein
MDMNKLFFLFCLCMISLFSQAQQPAELGKVQWLRNYEQALDRAAAEGKCVLILFQEVPGCATCRNYGSGPLSHPLIVEAIESLFVPLCIYNNEGGEDAKVLKRYREPAWNNPVVRIVDAAGADVTDRLSGNYNAAGLVETMTKALGQRGQSVPGYLALLQEEMTAYQRGTATASLSMYCFWTGEKQLGQLSGVVATQAGFMDGREVVRVTYDPAVLPFEELVEAGQSARCADGVYVNGLPRQELAAKVVGSKAVHSETAFRPDDTPKYYLAQTLYRFVPMTPLQSARANALIGKGDSPEAVLSPRQIQLAAQISARPKAGWRNAIGEDFQKAWEAFRSY